MESARVRDLPNGRSALWRKLVLHFRENNARKLKNTYKFTGFVVLKIRKPKFLHLSSFLQSACYTVIQLHLRPWPFPQAFILDRIYPIWQTYQPPNLRYSPRYAAAVVSLRDLIPKESTKNIFSIGVWKNGGLNSYCHERLRKLMANLTPSNSFTAGIRTGSLQNERLKFWHFLNPVGLTTAFRPPSTWPLSSVNTTKRFVKQYCILHTPQPVSSSWTA
jgi:hypothetical protein